MRVLVLGWEFPPHISGGLGTACQGLVEGLVSNGADVTVVLPRVHGDEAAGDARIVDCGVPESPHREVTLDAALLPYLTAEQYTRLAERTGRSGEFGEDLFAEVGRYARAVPAHVEGTYDVVHAHDWMTFPAGAATANKLGIPLVLHVHSCEYDRAGDQAHPRILAVEQKGLDAADRVICVSRYTANQLRERYDVDANKVRVVHNAVSDSGSPVVRKPQTRLDEPIVLFMGRVTAQKGPTYFLEAAALVARELPSVKFVLAGGGDMLSAMIERAAELGLARHVHFTGFLRGPEVDRMYDEASVFVMPSVSEPFGIAPLEALSRDVPVIVSRNSGVSEVLANVLKVDFWNVEELAGHILAVLRRPELAQRLAEGGREEVRGLTWERQAAQVLDVFREVTQ